MDFKGINEKKLAELFAESPQVYNNLCQGLKSLRDTKILSPSLDKLLPAAINLVEKAGAEARKSDYFAFRVYDSWAERGSVWGVANGYLLYQKVNNKMVQKIGLGSGSPAQIENITGFLKSRKVKRIFTLEIKGDYFGIKEEETHQLESTSPVDVVEKKALEDSDIDELKKKGIEVIVLTP